MKKIVVLICILLFSLSFSVQVFAALEFGTMKLFAVTSDGKAVSADLDLKLVPGNGDAWSSVEPLVGTTTQAAEKTAVQVAKNYSPQVQEYDYLFGIKSEASLVEGPSAGAAMTLMVISLLQEKPLDPAVSVTGTIKENGEVGGVGGVFEKSQEAARIGIKLFMIPEGEASQVIKTAKGIESVHLPEYAWNNWKMKIIEVKNIDEVLLYAYSNINDLDINAGSPSENVPEFVPNAIPYSESLEPMHLLTKKYLDKANALVQSARASLSTTLLDDPALISVLLNSLNESEQTLKQAEMLYDQNYFYSAANYSFISIVNAQTIKEISENTAIVGNDSTSLDLKIVDLQKRASGLEEEINKGVAVNGLEWYIASQERLAWAKQKLVLLSKQTVTISVDTGEIAQESPFERVQNYSFALAWTEAAEDFYETSNNSSKRAIPDDFFKQAAENQIAAAEDALSNAPEESLEDIQRRIESAKLELEQKWYLAALFDSVSAVSLLNAEYFSQEKTPQELRAALVEKISSLQKQISDSKQDSVWANLYLDHARYYLQESDYYSEKNQQTQAISSLKNGLSLAYLAEGIFSASFEIYSHYSQLPASQYVTVQSQNNKYTVQQEFPVSYFAIIVIVIFAFIVLASIALKNQQLSHSSRATYSVPRQMGYITMQQHKMSEAFSRGKVSEQKFREMNELYNKQLLELEKKRRFKSSRVVQLDKLRAELIGLNYSLKNLKNHYLEGLVIDSDYRRNLDALQQRMEQIRKTIEEQKNQLHEIEQPGQQAEEQASVEKIIEKEQKSALKQKAKAKKKKSKGKK